MWILIQRLSSYLYRCFVEQLGNSTSYQAGPCGAMREIEIAFKKNLLNLWLEKYSSLVVQAFKSSNLIPWKVRNSWNIWMLLLRNMNFIDILIYIGKEIM